MSLTLRISLLGGFSLIYGDQPLSTITAGRSQRLLAYLMLYRAKAQPRERVAFQIWPDSNEAQARANLRKELSRLRRGLPADEEWLWTDTKLLQWRPKGDYSLDIEAFEVAAAQVAATANQATRRSNLEQAINLYRGDLLPNFDDDWVFPERERLRQLYSRSLEQLTSLLEAQQEYPLALTHAQQMLRLDELNEAAYCTLMRLYGLMGDRSNALQMYHQCMTILREELGIDPSTTTRKLYEQLLCDDDVPTSTGNAVANRPLNTTPETATTQISSLAISQSHVAQFPLVGRELEWSALRQWSNPTLKHPDQVNASQSANVMLLVGEPGIGKTRLMEELQATAQANQAQVLWAQGFAAEMMRPYGIWIDALRSAGMVPDVNDVSVSPELRFLLPELGQPPLTPPDPSQLLDAVVQLLVERAKQAPLVMILDDIQWFDEASSTLMHYAIRLLRPLPVLFACTARPREMEDNMTMQRVFQALRREQKLQRIDLEPLDREQTADLIRSTQAVDPADLSLEIVNQVFIDSGGNPLFTLEIARALAQQQTGQTNNIEALIQDRLQLLDDDAQAVLPWAAALGRSFNPSTIAQVANYPLATLLGAIEELEQQSIIRPSATVAHERDYDFAHDIVRRVVYQQLSAPRRQLVHLQISQQLQAHHAQDPSMAGDIAHHAALGGEQAVAAAAYLGAAEHGLRLFAYTDALELAQKGIEYCEGLTPKKQIPLRAKLIEACVVAGVTGERGAELAEEVQQLHQQAAALNLTEAATIVMDSLLNIQFVLDNYVELHEHSLQMAAASRVANPADAVRMLAHSGSCLAEIGRDMIRAEAVLLEAQSLAERLGLRSADINCGLGCIHRHYGRYAAARSNLRTALAVTQAEQDHWIEILYLRYLIMVEIEADTPVDALSDCETMITLADQMQSDGSEVAIARGLKALVRYCLAETDAELDLVQALDVLEQLDSQRSLAYLLLWAGKADFDGGRYELAVTRSTMALDIAKRLDQPSEIAHSWALWVQGLWAMGERRLAATQYGILQEIVDRDFINLPARQALEQLSQQIQARAPAISRHSQQR
ncbi:AAA family ATPase [filamentous cyanobacterium LEGE 11480]|uniref:AAA family ATPase n=1 Tax=Romeriopsis navalis LEGE 11480 TaxID=2777977 RepID=A0A928Z1Z8_9CYAN|nr:BTAD domain-containing putative transcriptional regulator [Romeriopsis navalis]MBE9029014.1 AAA family ATPase [Romeriopsis navalis LEGE 11480]